MTDGAVLQRRERVSAGLPELDAILSGGFLRRAVYMIQGRPGAGKTILANQVAFEHARAGGRVVYVTLLSETHERIMYNLEQLAFFDATLIPDRISYLSAFGVLEESGLKGLSELLRREASAARATLLVVDGLVAVGELAPSSKHYQKFIHDVQIHAGLVGCAVLLLSSAAVDPVGPEHTMVDGVIALSDQRVGKRAVRELEVTKFRGSNYLEGGHSFQISSAGITVFPRLEALLQDPSSTDQARTNRLSTGVTSLDRALTGGLMHASSTVLVGASGTGKTTLGLHFLNGSSEVEPGLHFGFYETPERVLIKAASLGLSLGEKAARGTVELLWHPTTERVLDALGATLVSAVRRRNVKRLFVDGIEGFIQSAPDPERITHFLSALTNELRTLGVTTIYTMELPALLSEEIGLPIRGVSSLLENMLLLRFAERDNRLLRNLAIVKLRDSGYDSTIRELSITERGAQLLD